MQNSVKMEKSILCPRLAVKVARGMLNFFLCIKRQSSSAVTIPPHPPPPGVTEGHLGSLSVPRGQAFANPEAAPMFFTACTWFLTQNPNTEEFT